MSRMTPEDVKYWKQQIEYADSAWYRAGIIENDHATGGRPFDVVPVSRFIDDYRGNQALPLHGHEESDQFIGNLTFSLMNSQIASINGRDPEFILRPKGETLARDGAHKRAAINQVLIQSHAREAKYRREVTRALQSAVTTPFGLVRHGYTPAVEEYSDEQGRVHERFKNHEPDFPWIQFVRPWDVRIDPSVGSFDPDAEPRWCAFRCVGYERDVKAIARKSENFHFPQDWSATYSHDLTGPTAKERNSKDEAPDIHELYEWWEIYDASTREWFAISPGSEKPIRDKQQWPIEWGQLPYSILTPNEQLDTPIGIPFPKLYAYEQDLYNRVWSIVKAMVNRIQRKIFVRKDALEEGEADKLTDPEAIVEFILCSGDPAQAAKEVGFGALDPQLLGLLYQLKESIRETMGLSNFDRGQRANVETAAEANSISAGAANQKGRLQGKFEDFWVNIISVSHRALFQVQDERRFVIPVVGMQNATFLDEDEEKKGFIEAGLGDLRGEFDYGVKVNSSLPQNMVEDYARMAAFYQLVGGPQSPDIDQLTAKADLANTAGIDASRWVKSPEQAKQIAQVQRAEGMGGSPEGGNGQDSVSPLLAAQRLGGMQ